MSEDAGFLDISASDLIRGYLEVEKLDAQTKIEKIKAQSATQQRTLHAPEVDSMQDAVNTGYAANRNGLTLQQYWDRIPKPLLYGSLLLLGGAVFVKAVK